MVRYKIVYIDEQAEDAGSFKDYVEEKDEQRQFDVKHLYPSKTLDKMLESIKEEAPDAIVCDYMLTEHIKEIGYPVPYTGADIVMSYLEIRNNFPCFVMTSFALKAAENSRDVNSVYVKGLLHADSDQNDIKDIGFLKRVCIQIAHYQNELGRAEERLQELLRLSDCEPLNAAKEDELIKLDSLLESSIDNRVGAKLPSALKNLSNTKKLSKLLSQVSELIAEVKPNE